jgi:hypothetical protein
VGRVLGNPGGEHFVPSGAERAGEDRPGVLRWSGPRALLASGRRVEDLVMSTPATALSSAPLQVGSALPGPADVVLADGRLAVIRRVEPGDGAALFALHDQVSDGALWMRFFNTSRPAVHRYVEHVLADPDTLATPTRPSGNW